MSLDTQDLLLSVALGFAALLYSAVGHGGASGYLAAMALAGVEPALMKPTALALNIVVSGIALVKFYKAGSFSWRLFLPLAVTAVPLAYVGGKLSLPVQVYKPLVGAILLYAAWRSIYTAASATAYALKPPSTPILCVTGAALGFLSGLTGVGGGIFLSPLLLLFRWAPIKVISGVAAAFIFCNSIAGLLGTSTHTPVLHSALPLWAVVVMVGGYVGAEYGSKRLANPTIQRVLALVLAIAGFKMILT